MIFGISTYLMSYLLSPIMYMFLVDPPSQLLEQVWYLSYSQVLMHSTHWLQPTGTPQTVQTPSPSVPQSCIPVLEGPPINPFHNAPSDTLNAKISLSKNNQKKKIYYINLLGCPEESITLYGSTQTSLPNHNEHDMHSSIINSSTNDLAMLTISVLYKWTNRWWMN